jgi:hypothetical protein
MSAPSAWPERKTILCEARNFAMPVMVRQIFGGVALEPIPA